MKVTMKYNYRVSEINKRKCHIDYDSHDDVHEGKVRRVIDLERPIRVPKNCLRAPSERLRKQERLKYKAELQTRNPGINPAMLESLLSLTEDIALSAYQLSRCRNSMDVVACVMVFCKLRTKQSMIKTLRIFVEDLVYEVRRGFRVQSARSFVHDFRQCLDKWAEIKDSDVGQKFIKVMNFLVNYGAMSWMGLEPDEKALYKMKKVTPVWNGLEFSYCVVDAVSLAVVRGVSWYESGDFSNFLHGAKTYQAWIDKTAELKRQSLHLGNIEAQGTTYFKFVNDLNAAIEQGESIVKYGTDKTLARYPAAILNEMRMLKASVISRKAAQQDRQAPFALLIHGNSSVGKSSFMKQLFVYYGKIMGLPTGSEYKYTRDTSKYWSGFSSDKWYLQLDDVGFINPASGQPDPTLLEMINIINNVPYIPDQAALEDKGRTPLRARLVLASSNTEDMNASHYFACPLAVQRRLPWVITPRPKPEYAQDDNPSMLDPTKIPNTPGWMDLWVIDVKRVMEGGTVGKRQVAKVKLVDTFDNIHKFFAWFKEVAIQFQKNQEKSMRYDAALQDAWVCPGCLSTDCDCPREEEENPEMVLQNGCYTEIVPNTTCVYKLPEGITYGDDFTAYVSTDEARGEPVVFTYTGSCYRIIINGVERQVQVTRRPYRETSGRMIALPEGIHYGEDFSIHGIEYQCDHTGYYGYVAGRTRKHCRVGYPGQKKEFADVLYADAFSAAVKQCKPSRAQSMLIAAVDCYLQYAWVRAVTNFVLTFSLPRIIAIMIVQCIRPSNTIATKMVMASGHYLESARKHKLAVLIAVVSAAVTAGTIYVLLKNGVANSSASVGEIEDPGEYDSEAETEDFEEFEAELKSKSKAREMESKEPDEVKPEDPVLNGNRLPVVASHFKKSEKENVWKRDDYQVTSFDVAPPMNNYAALPLDTAIAKIRANVGRIHIIKDNSRIPGHIFCVGGRLWVTNNHVMSSTTDSFEVEIFFDPVAQGTSRNMKVKLYQKQLLRMPERDLCFFELHGCDVRKDLTKLVALSTFTGVHRAKVVSFSREHAPEVTSLSGLRRSSVNIPALGGEMPIWLGAADRTTVNGTCGAPVVVYGATLAIVGLHMLGPPEGSPQKFCGSTPLTSDAVDIARTHFARPTIQSEIPSLECGETKKVLGPLSHRSPLRWIEQGTVTVFGTFVGPSAVPRTKCEYTHLGEKILQERGWKLPFGAPDMKDWRPWHHAYNEIFMQKQLVDPVRLRKVSREYSRHIIEGVRDQLDMLQKLDVYSAINGIAGVRYIDKMNFNTSMGEPWNRSKKYFLTPAPTDEMPDGKVFLPEIMERISAIDAKYQKGIRACPVFSGQQKDEVRKISKLANGQVRIFTGAPADWSVVVRQYLLPFVKLMQENQLVFGAMPGCVAQSIEWENLMKHIVKFGDQRLFAGDFRAYDKNLVSMLMLEAVEVIATVYRAAGWTEEELLPIYTYGEDVSFAYVNMNGDLVMFTGSNPSGQPLTVIINCLVNILLMMYVYDEAREEKGVPDDDASAFWNNVAPATYGDDNVVGVSERCTWFDHSRFSQGLEGIGIIYTMADKSSESIPFISIEEVSFLKRAWRWDEDIGAHVCPLEEESIQKMLTMHVKGKTLSDEAHMCAVMVAAANEWFWYGKERFTNEVSWMRDLVEKHGLQEEAKLFPLPTYDELLERFRRASMTDLSERTL